MTRQYRRPRSRACPLCGERTSLIRCGVEAHARRIRTQRQKIEGLCGGYVYAHDESGAIDSADCDGVES